MVPISPPAVHPRRIPSRVTTCRTVSSSRTSRIFSDTRMRSKSPFGPEELTDASSRPPPVPRDASPPCRPSLAPPAPARDPSATPAWPSLPPECGRLARSPSCPFPVSLPVACSRLLASPSTSPPGRRTGHQAGRQATIRRHDSSLAIITISAAPQGPGRKGPELLLLARHCYSLRAASSFLF